MRIAILLGAPLIMGLAPTAETPPAPPSSSFGTPGYGRSTPSASEYPGESCTDVVEHAREANGQPPLDERDGEAPEPMMYKAVDRDVGGCDVLVMADDTDDIRPVPQGGPLVLHPADGN
ncbi:MAG: hypothetical protein CL808_04760 [Citromicrobium sp.]|mgnify:CR=1 FL=1|nr:hypothetical protein [Citromicrobium sp.]